MANPFKSIFCAPVDLYFVLKLLSGVVCVGAGSRFVLAVSGQFEQFQPTGSRAYLASSDYAVLMGLWTILAILVFGITEYGRRQWQAARQRPDPPAAPR